MLGNRAKLLCQIDILNYRVQGAQYNLNDDSVNFNLVSPFSDKPNIWVSVKYFTYFTNAMARATVVGLGHELTLDARSYIETLVREIASNIKNYMSIGEDHRHAKN